MTDVEPLVMKVLQVNLNHCWAVQQLLLQTIAERGIDVVVVSDYNRQMGVSAQQWVASMDSKCAIYVANSTTYISDRGGGFGFAWARIGSTLFYSCYFTPNCTIQEFNQFLGDLDASIRNRAIVGLDIIVAGDFNSHSAEWGSATDNARGSLLIDFAASLELVVCNVGSTPTFRRVIDATVIDVTFSRSGGNRPIVSDWFVITDCYNASDHEYIGYSVLKPEAPGPAAEHKATLLAGWSTKKLSLEAINVHWDRTGTSPPLPEDGSAEEHVEQLQEFLKRAFNAAMPNRSVFQGKRAGPLVERGDRCNAKGRYIVARRRYQRARRRANMPGREAAFETYNRVRKELRLAIRIAQERSWQELCNTVESDPWGVPYRIVTKRLGRRPPVIEEPVLTQIAHGLFPALPPVEWELVPASPSACSELIEHHEVSTPLFTVDELSWAVEKLSLGKAPGPNSIPNEVIKLAARRSPDTFLSTFNVCLTKRVFPSRWKLAKLVLLHKGADKPLDQPSSYRPISLLDGSGKLLERMLLNRLGRHVEETGALSNLHFGFKCSRSTEDAIQEVLRTARAAGKGAVQNRHLRAVMTLDVKNAFNTAPWLLIDAALHRSGAPEYLTGILRSYMSEREVQFGAGSCLPVTCGVPQGSVLGPTLWNLFYDGILRLPVPNGVKLVAFADDVVLVAVAHNAELMEQLVNPVLCDVARWMSANGLTLASEKSECVILTSKYRFGTLQLEIQGVWIPVKRDINIDI